MYNSYFALQETPFSVTPDPDRFYLTIPYQELFTTIRYGIEARKGLILITGEVGTGKTTLMRRLMRGLESTTQFILLFHTRLSFIELLRLIARDLDLQPQAKGSAATLDEIRSYLTAQFQNGRVVCLLIDEAQNLSDAAFEGIRCLSNLDIDGQKLLQIVLMGQPELEAKLDQLNLRHVKQRVALRCQVPPLEKKEVGPYIEFRLRAAGYAGKALFSPAAADRVAFYSKGAPRLINIICDNALIVAQAELKKEISGELIERVAWDQRLKDPPFELKTESPAARFSGDENRERALPAVEEDAMETTGEDEAWRSGFEKEFQAPGDEWPVRRHKRRGAVWAGTGLLFAGVVFAGATAALYSPQTKAYLMDLGVNLEEVMDSARRLPEQIQLGNAAKVKEEPLVVESPKSQAPQEEALLPENENGVGASLPQTEPAVEPQALPPESESPAPKAPDKPPSRAERAVKNREDSTELVTERNRLTVEIHKAINNRAITGVQVSVVGGIAFLDGRVETERQKAAAEEAARSVPAIKYIRNRIEVNFPSGYEGAAGPAS